MSLLDACLLIVDEVVLCCGCGRRTMYKTRNNKEQQGSSKGTGSRYNDNFDI